EPHEPKVPLASRAPLVERRFRRQRVEQRLSYLGKRTELTQQSVESCWDAQDQRRGLITGANAHRFISSLPRSAPWGRLELTAPRSSPCARQRLANRTPNWHAPPRLLLEKDGV